MYVYQLYVAFYNAKSTKLSAVITFQTGNRSSRYVSFTSSLSVRMSISAGSGGFTYSNTPVSSTALPINCHSSVRGVSGECLFPAMLFNSGYISQ